MIGKKNKSLEIDKTLNWEIAEVTNIEQFISEIKLIKNNKKS